MELSHQSQETLRPLKNDLVIHGVLLQQELTTHHAIHISHSVVLFDPCDSSFHEGGNVHFPYSFLSLRLFFFKSYFLNEMEMCHAHGFDGDRDVTQFLPAESGVSKG